MDHKEEQNNEIEALESIYCGELESTFIGYINLTLSWLEGFYVLLSCEYNFQIRVERNCGMR